MNFEGAKENIQPLITGRNIERLEVALNAESHPEYQEELLQQRIQFEKDIANYDGDDPLDLWFEYVSWIEQSYPKSGKESTLDDLLEQCLVKFEPDIRYRQDQRLIRLFIKFIDSKQNPHLYYMKMYSNGVGTMVADLYIAWAHYYDIADNMEQAEQVYQKGLDARAAPVEQLKQAHEKFHFSVSQRVLRKDAYRQEFLTSMEERRNAFTSLRSLKSKVGSVRTGRAVQSHLPGRVRQDPSSSTKENISVNVFEENSNATSNAHMNNLDHMSTSVVHDIQNSMMENTVEPGPWSKASSSSKRGVFHNKSGKKSILGFAILEDSDTDTPPINPLPRDDGILGIKLPPNFARKNEPQTKKFEVPSYVVFSIQPHIISAYDYIFLHPNKDQSFSIEELRAYKYYKKHDITNCFTEQQDKIWKTGSNIPMRLPPTFARKNLPYIEFSVERPDIASIPKTEHFKCRLNELYPPNTKEEFSFEELLRNKWVTQSQLNQLDEMMDETICVRGRQSFGMKYIRKTIIPEGRKSIMPDRASTYFFNTANTMDMTIGAPSNVALSDSDMEIEDDNVNKPQKSFQATADSLNGPHYLPKPSQMNDKMMRNTPPTASNQELKKAEEIASSLQWSIFQDEEQKDTPPTLIDDEKKRNTLPIPSNEELKKTEEMATGYQRSIFQNEDTPPSVISDEMIRNKLPIASNFELRKNKQLPTSAHWSIYHDEEPESEPLIVSTKCNPINEISSIVQLPELLESSQTIAKKNSPEFLSKQKSVESGTPEILRKNCLMGPSTGAIKKIRRSSTTESIVHGMKTASNDENAFKLPEPLADQATEANDFDYSFCTQKFNINLRDQMVSTPVAIRRKDVLAEQIKLQEVVQPLHPLKLSTIMETTEGSAHTASTKSSTQFSSPEDDDIVKHSNFMNRTKFSAANTGLASDSSDSNLNNSKFEENLHKKEQPISRLTCNNLCEIDGATNNLPANQNFVPSPATDQCSIVQNNTNIPSAADSALAPITVDSKNYPFPIFEDTQHTANISKMKTCCKNDSMDDSILNYFTASPVKSISPEGANTPVTHNVSLDNDKTVMAPALSISFSESELGNLNDLQSTNTKEFQTTTASHFDSPNHPSTSIAAIDDADDRSSGDEVVEVVEVLNESDDGHDHDQSIYYQHNSKYIEPSWREIKIENNLATIDNTYEYNPANLEESKIVIEGKLAQGDIDPLDPELRDALLQEVDFVAFLEKDDSCDLVKQVPSVMAKGNISFKDIQFEIVSFIGQGAFGRVYSVKSVNEDRMYAVKKEVPANLWEYYILSEVHCRIMNSNLICGFMKIDYAIIGNNASILFSEFTSYGSLLDVSNRVFTSLRQHVNESIVFILAVQMLDIIDHLHAARIIHLDLKPDNFLVMRKLSSNYRELFIQLIDFGNAVDLKRFPEGQTFNATLETKNFVCVEMLENRPWIYQPDLYCLAGTIHAILFGRYMEVEKKSTGYEIKRKIPRYFNRILWERFFKILINTKDCHSKPDLQELKENFLVAIDEDKKLQEKISIFNNFIIKS